MALQNVLRIAVACLLLQRTSFRLPNVVLARIDLDDPIFYYTTTELACSEGYSVQEHTVVTDDGYILTVHRIPNGRNRPKVPRNKHQYQKLHLNHHPDFDECVNESLNLTSTGFPMILVHGLQMTSDSWLMQGPGYDLAYILADTGYDVWLANGRGSFYTKKHVTLSPSDPKFWNFSFHENAVSDLPATIDHVLKVTKKDKVGYIGLSMGSTIFLSMASMKPEYNDKILGCLALAPVVFMKKEYMSPKRRLLFKLMEILGDALTKRQNIYEVFPRSPVQMTLMKNYCSAGSIFQDFCYDFFAAFMGDHSKLVLRDPLHKYLTRFPAGNSMKTFSHYLQGLKRGSFKLYDYGSKKNMEFYGSPTPPDYPLWKITAPVALYYSTGDAYYDVRDVQDLVNVLPNVREVIEYQSINHADFLGSFKARDIVYPNVTSFFKNLIDQYDRDTKHKGMNRAAEK